MRDRVSSHDARVLTMDGSIQRDSAPTRRIEQYIARMPSLSITVTRVMEICNSPATSPHDLNRVISLDPVLTGQVLKLVNSAYYGLRNKVTALPRAIIMLGMNTIKNLAVSSAILNTMSDEGSFQALDLEAFWLHSLSTAVGAKWLASAGGVSAEDREDYFVGGLLHDLGKIPLNNLYPDDYRQIMAEVAKTGDDLCEREQAVLGVDHMQIGGMIAEKWKLGEILEDCLRCHHETWQSREQSIAIVRTIALADLCAKGLGAGNAGGSPCDGNAMENLSRILGLDHIILDELEPIMEDEVEKARIFLNLTKNDDLEEGSEQ